MAASTISITKNGTSITNKVMFSTANFDAMSSAGVGTFNFTCKDPDRTLSFTTGDEIVLTLDGHRYFGGWVMQASAIFAFPAVNTTGGVSTVRERQWRISGVNYNAIFDRLVTRKPSDYTTAIPPYSGTTMAGTIVKDLAQNYLDIPAGFNVTTHVDPVGTIHPFTSDEFLLLHQGATFREQMDQRICQFNNAIYYFDADKNLHFHAPEKVFARWGFSDRPNKLSIGTSGGAKEFKGATYGFRELDATEDISSIVNDVFVWGGSEWAASEEPGASGVVFARRSNSASIGEYGRWQLAEPAFNDLKSQAQVNARAEAIVPPAGSDAPPGVGSDGVIRNRSMPSWNIRLSWFAHDVPVFSNNLAKNHLVPGDIVTIILYVHGKGLANPMIRTLPLRRVGISFPTLPANTGGAATTFARFDGEFGLSLDDPFNLWEAILNRRVRATRLSPTGGGTATAWGGSPNEAPNGSRTTFTLASGPYIATTSRVYVNGILRRQGSDYQENVSGSISFFVAPPTGSTIFVEVMKV